MSSHAVESQDESELLRRARSGDRAAFEELVRRHQHEVFTLAMRLTHDQDMAADVGQEALIRAWRALPGFRGDARFSTWLHRITVNVAWTHRRRRARYRAEALSETTSIVDPSPGPDQAGEALEQRARIRRALAQLPATQRSVVVLKDLYGSTHGEISEALGISITASKVRLHRARTRLKELLRDRGR